MATAADYAQLLLEAAETHTYQTAKGVPVEDMNRLTHQLRYQAAKLELDIHIETDKETLTVSFITRRISG